MSEYLVRSQHEICVVAENRVRVECRGKFFEKYRPRDRINIVCYGVLFMYRVPEK